MTMDEPEASLPNGDSSRPTRPNGISHTEDNMTAFVMNSVLPINGTSSLTDASESLNPPMAKAQLNEDPAVQHPISELRQPIDPASIAESHEQNETLSSVGKLEPVSGSLSTDASARNDTIVPEPLSFVEDPMDISASVESVSHVDEIDLPHHPAVPTTDGALPEAPIDPPATPVDEVPEIERKEEVRHPTMNGDLPPPSVDQVMEDAPLSPGKVARSRDDEDEEDRLFTKRLKAEDDGSAVPEFKVPDVPLNNVSEPIVPTSVPAVDENLTAPAIQTQEANTALPSLPMTKPQHRFLVKSIQNMRRTNTALLFTAPVDYVALKIPTYPDIIKKPMDLRTMEEKLKADEYSSVNTYVSDFNQIVENSVTFNGPEHPVTKAAQTLKVVFDKQMEKLPSADVKDPVPAEKKSKTVAAVPAPKAPPTRRESRSSLGNPKTPTSATSQPTFALGPQGVPLIRRDSTVADGRPKREIHPPAPRDLPYSNQKPKKKKYLWELRFCQEVLHEMKKAKYTTIGWPFQNPVDPVALNIPTYHAIIKKPMDLSTVEKKLKEGQYENAKEFETDVRLMFGNCYKFNPSTDNVHQLGKQYEKVFDGELAKKKKWIDEHAPASGPQSPGSSPEPDEDEDEEEEEEEEEEEADDELSVLQKQIAGLSKQVEMIQKKKASPPAPTKKTAKGNKATKPAPKKSGSSAPAKHDRKPSKPAKKPTRNPIVTYEQKQDISNRINMLPEKYMAQALKIIRENMPNLKVSSQFPISSNSA